MIKKKAVTKKKSPQKKSASTTKTVEPILKIISTSKCQTVSNKSTLNYQIGVDDKNEVYIRVNGNTGGGYFSNEWVSLDHITSILGDVTGEHITSINLIPLFKGKSVNTPGYLLAVLLKEGLLAPFEEGKKRQYVFSGADKFITKLEKKL